MKKIIALILALTMVMALAACGGNGGSAPAADNKGGEEVIVTIFNTKSEITTQMEEMAEKYSAEHEGVKIEIYYSNDTVAAHMATKYAANDPYVISMVDPKDVYSLGAEHALDLSGEKWVEQTSQAISVDGKVYGFPVCVEARGIIYNADAIKNVTGKDFDPTSIKTTADFQALIDELIAGGMADPCGIMKEDWSLGAHYLCQVFEQQADPDAYIAGIKDGSIKFIEDKKFNDLMDTFDVLKANNYAKAAAISAEREVSEQKLAEGEIAFMFGGNWDWSVINAYDYTENMGIMPVPNNSGDGTSDKLVGGGSKYYFIDNSEYITDAQREAAKDFLNWLVFEAEGQDFLVNTCALVPAFANIELPVSDPLGASVKAYADAGNMTPNYNYMPDDHYAKCGASFQKYLAGEVDRAGFADELTAYWATAEVGAH